MEPSKQFIEYYKGFQIMRRGDKIVAENSFSTVEARSLVEDAGKLEKLKGQIDKLSGIV